jgi:hypothetical protein
VKIIAAPIGNRTRRTIEIEWIFARWRAGLRGREPGGARTKHEAAFDLDDFSRGHADVQRVAEFCHGNQIVRAERCCQMMTSSRGKYDSPCP